MNTDDQSCWLPPSLPPTANNSTKYARDTCNVCVSQSLPDPKSFATNGTIKDYNFTIRDDANHDMGAINVTLAAFGGETGGKKTNVTILIGGKPFHLWTIRVPQSSVWAAVFLDYGGPGPADPLRVPPMVFDATEYEIGFQACLVDGISPENTTVYFQCQFPC